jgi:hypothetical protein
MNIRRPEGHLGHFSILLWFSFVYIRGYATPRHATVTLAVSQHSGREREREIKKTRSEPRQARERKGSKLRRGTPGLASPRLALPSPPPLASSSFSLRLDPRWLVSASRLCFDCTLPRFIPFFAIFSCCFESACAVITPVSAVSSVGFVT